MNDEKEELKKAAEFVNKLPDTLLKDGTQTVNISGTPANIQAKKLDLIINTINNTNQDNP